MKVSSDCIWEPKSLVKGYKRLGFSMPGGYYKHRDRWRICIPWEGKNQWIYTYFDGSPIFHVAQAERVLERIRSEIDQGTFDPSSWNKDKAQVFQNAWSYYMKQYPAKQARNEQREMIFKTYLLPYWKDKILKDIEDPHIAEWFSKLQEFAPKNKEELAPSYKRLIVVTLKAFLNSFNVTRRKVLRFPIVSVPKKAQPWFSQDEQDLVLEFISKQHEGIIRFIVTYGVRPSEACNLRKADIDWKKREIILQNRKNEQDNTLPILPEIESILKETKQVEHLEYQFSTSTGLKYTRQQLYSIWRRANQKARNKHGLRVITIKNSTRHSLASRLINDDTPIPVIARILGNSPSQIERVYGKVTVKKVAEVLEFKKTKNG